MSISRTLLAIGVAVSALTNVDCGVADPTRIWIADMPNGKQELAVRTLRDGDPYRLQSSKLKGLYRPEISEGSNGTATLRGGEMPALDLVPHRGALLPVVQTHLVALSAFYHLQEARAYFELVAEGALDAMPEHQLALFPRFAAGIEDDVPRSDNAFFVPTEQQGLVGILPEQLLQSVPLASHAGVITHEFSHAIFHQFDTNQVQFRTLNEGLADFLAATRLNNPSFLDDALPEPIAKQRRLDLVRSITSVSELDSLVAASAEDPYELGAYASSALWSFRSQLPLSPQDASARSALIIINALAAGLPKLQKTDSEQTGFRVFFFEAWNSANETERPILCSILVQRLPVFVTPGQGCGE